MILKLLHAGRADGYICMQKQIGTFLQFFVGNTSDGTEGTIWTNERKVVDIQKLIWSFLPVT